MIVIRMYLPSIMRQELAEATEPDHVAAETADVLYFAMVACARAGVGLREIEHHLNKRNLKIRRRRGDTKEHRIKAANEALAQLRARQEEA